MKLRIKAKNPPLLLITIGFYLLTIGLIQIYGQELSSEKCDEFLLNYKKNYKECLGREFVEQFIPRIVNKFGITNLEVEWASMDDLHLNYISEPDQHIFIVAYGGKTNKYGEIKERTKRIMYYLTENRKINPKNITLINAGFREAFEFEFWFSPSEKIYPPLSLTIDVEKVKFKGKMKPLPYELGN